MRSARCVSLLHLPGYRRSLPLIPHLRCLLQGSMQWHEHHSQMPSPTWSTVPTSSRSTPASKLLNCWRSIALISSGLISAILFIFLSDGLRLTFYLKYFLFPAFCSLFIT